MSVLHLELFRQRKNRAVSTGEYYCTKCDSRAFRFSESGEVKCSKCGARIRNLRVVRDEPQCG